MFFKDSVRGLQRVRPLSSAAFVCRYGRTGAVLCAGLQQVPGVTIVFR